MIQEHNQVKQALMNEIKTLRAAMPAQQDQLVADLMKNEEVMKKQEEELIQIHIERDMLKVSVAIFGCWSLYFHLFFQLFYIG